MAKKVAVIDDSDIEDEFKIPTEQLNAVLNYDKAYYPTQFYMFNTLTGMNMRDEKSNEIISRPRGLREGSMMISSGEPQIGKTTMLFNMGGQVKRYCDTIAERAGLKARCEVAVLSPEDGMELHQMMKLSGITEDHIRRGEFKLETGDKMCTEYIGDWIEQEYERKMRNKKNLMIPTMTVGGKIKETMMPTYLILDSWSTLIPKKFKDTEANNNMYYAQVTSENNKLIKSVFGKLRDANIMLNTVAHKSNKMAIDPYNPNKADFQNLHKDTKLSVGKVTMYYADIVMYFNKILERDTNKQTVRQTLGTEDKSISYASEIGFIKNRMGDSSPRSQFSMVFDYSVGFNPYWSLVYDIISDRIPILETVGSYKMLPGWDRKFYKKDFDNLFRNDLIFRKLVLDAIEREYEWILESHNIGKSKMRELDTLMGSMCM